MNRPWRVSFWAVAAFLAVLALVWLSYPMTRALAAPERRISDLECRKDLPVPAIKIGDDGRLMITYRNRRGCVSWVPFVPMVRSR
jgi:hypothetical protein